MYKKKLSILGFFVIFSLSCTAGKNGLQMKKSDFNKNVLDETGKVSKDLKIKPNIKDEEKELAEDKPVNQDPSLENAVKIIFDYMDREFKGNSDAFFWKELEKTYVPLQGIDQGDVKNSKSFDLAGEGVDPFLKSNKKVLLLYAQGGSGKSVFIQKLEQSLRKKHKNINLNLWIPIYIQLGSINGPLSDYINDKLKLMGIDDKLISKLQKQLKVVFLLDAYDELTKELIKKKTLFEGLKIDKWEKSKAVITSREEKIQKPYSQYFTKRDKFYKQLKICDFDKAQVKRFITKFLAHFRDDRHLGWGVDTYLQKIDDIYDLKEKLSKIPILLRLIVDVLPELIKRNEDESKNAFNISITRNQLFEEFLKQYFGREWDKGKDKQEHKFYSTTNRDEAIALFWSFGETLAYEMNRNQAIFFTWKPREKKKRKKRGKKVKKEEEKSTVKDEVDWKVVFKDIEQFPTKGHDHAFRGLPVCKMRGLDNAFKFWHVTMQSYLNAQYVVSKSKG